MKLRFHPRVQQEVNEAVTWYEEQRPGLGDEFLVKLDEALDKAGERPESFGFWLGSQNVRCVKVKRFPYDILFEILTDRVRVLCVRHEKRHPRYGMGRD